MAEQTSPDNQLSKDNLGRTIGDLIHELLISPRKGFSLLLLLTLFVVVCLVGAWGFTRVFNVETSELKLGGNDPHIIFQSVAKQGGEYLVIVSPEGWQSSGISIEKGDHLSFTAGGKVCIDLNSILEKVDRRLSYEREWEKKLKLRRDDPSETRIPEDYFTAEQRKNLIPDRPWVGPDGFSLDKFLPSFRSRRSRYLLPDKAAGGLVGGVTSDAEIPGRDKAFFVGKQGETTANESGTLWLTVNDVQFSDPENSNLFYNDNVGSFWVKVNIKHR